MFLGGGPLDFFLEGGSSLLADVVILTPSDEKLQRLRAG
jgi:hypothetical protein